MDERVITAKEKFGPKIDVRSVFEHDRAVLIDLLTDLQPDEWQQHTACAPWLVRDVVAHLIGGKPDQPRCAGRHVGDDLTAGSANVARA